MTRGRARFIKRDALLELFAGLVKPAKVEHCGP
jgi:hypothetical protein